MLSKTELAREVHERIGVGTTLVKNVMDVIAEIAAEQIASGHDFSMPGVTKIAWRYTAPRAKGSQYKKGETYVGFGGVEQVAEADSKVRKASVRLVATPAPAVKKHAPKREAAAQSSFIKSKAGKTIVSRKS
jgi:nucleoid DNA-binding protein